MNFNSIYNADCFEGIKQIPDKSIDLIVTDPPYLVDCQGGPFKGPIHTTHLDDANAFVDGFDFAILDEFCRVLKKINLYVFCSQKQLIPYLDYFVKGKGCNYNLLCWHKTNVLPMCGNKYLNDTEYILFFREPGVPLYDTIVTAKTYFITSVNSKDKKAFGHPTCKPVDILKTLITNSSKQGETVLDPFMGSGSTAIACMRSGRQYIGFEIDETYYKNSIDRITLESIAPRLT